MTYCKAAYKGKPALRIKTPCNTHIEKNYCANQKIKKLLTAQTAAPSKMKTKAKARIPEIAYS